MKNFAFRVDASLQIGTGHVMRCLTLADALRAHGHQCHFICREQPGTLAEYIQELGFAVHILPFEETATLDVIHAPYTQWLGDDLTKDANQTSNLIQSLCIDWLIIDHYALDHKWEKYIQNENSRIKIMVIDDLADRPHFAAVLLDQNFGRKAEEYVGLVPDNCRLLIGPKFALLRPEFASYRPESLSRRTNRKLTHLMISMGGTDIADATSSVLLALQVADMPSDLHLSVVMGSSSPALSRVRNLASQMFWRTEVLIDVRNMASLMTNADLAIGAGGITTWERCCLGLPSAIVETAANQEGVAETLEKAGAALAIGQLSALDFDKRIVKVVSKLLKLETNCSIGLRSAELCTGHGAKLVAECLLDEQQIT
jgi:UDP-2,4-diacetamido-2,4,6-trideoxy-beta-L-altropyranose hydrolase